MASLRGEVKPVRERGDRVNGAHFRTVSPQRHSCCCTWLYRWKVTEVPVWRMKRRRLIETFKSLSTFHTWPIDARSGCVCVCVCVCSLVCCKYCQIYPNSDVWKLWAKGGFIHFDSSSALFEAHRQLNSSVPCWEWQNDEFSCASWTAAAIWATKQQCIVLEWPSLLRVTL